MLSIVRVAVTIFGSTISPLCDSARRLALVEILGGEVRAVGEEEVGHLDLPGKLALLRSRGVRVLVCGAISGFFSRALIEQGVRVYPWVSGEVDEVLRVVAARLAREDRGRRGPERIAVTATGPGVDSAIAPSFGRCSHYLVLERRPGGEVAVVEAIEDDVAQPGRCCVAVASRLVASGATVVLTGRCGPNAQGVLGAAGVQVVLGVEGTVRDVVRRYRRGQKTEREGGGARRGRMVGRGRRHRGG